MWNCPTCLKSFSSVSNLNYHQKNTKSCHINEEVTPHKCEFCQKELSTVKSLARHQTSCKVKNSQSSKHIIDDLAQKYSDAVNEIMELKNQIKLLEQKLEMTKTNCEEKVNLVKEFIPAKIKSNKPPAQNDDQDPTSNITNINGKNVYITQNQIFIDKVNTLTPINDLLEKIIQDGNLYNRITSSVEDFTHYVHTEISKCVLIKNLKKLMVCYRVRNSQDQIISLVDSLQNIVEMIYFDDTFASRIEEIYKIYDRENPVGEDTNLLEQNNNLHIFSAFLKSEEKNQKIKDSLLKRAVETILKKANTLRN